MVAAMASADTYNRLSKLGIEHTVESDVPLIVAMTDESYTLFALQWQSDLEHYKYKIIE